MPVMDHILLKYSTNLQHKKIIEKNKDSKAFCLIGNKRKFKAGVDFTTLQKWELERGSKSNDLEDSSIMHTGMKPFLKVWFLWEIFVNLTRNTYKHYAK